MTTTTLDKPVREFVPLVDRCDRCQAEAMHAAIKNNLEVLFCSHHWHQHADKLFYDGWKIADNPNRPS